MKNNLNQRPRYAAAVAIAMVAWALAAPQCRRSIAAEIEDGVTAKRNLWAERLLEQIDQLPEDGRRLPLLDLAGAGRAQQARSLVTKVLPETERPAAFMFIAKIQSHQADVPGALETLDALPAGSDPRQIGLCLVAVAQAQEGNPGVAERLIKGIEPRYVLDLAHSNIAVAYARLGNEAAATAAAKLISDAYKQRETWKSIAAAKKGELFSVDQITSPHLSAWIGALLQFSSDDSWETPVCSALAAAYRNDPKGLTAAAGKSTARLATLPAGLDRATGYAMLAAAFAQAGDAEEAAKAEKEALKAMPADIVGISSLFGTPILTYAMIQLGHYEQIEAVIEADRQSMTKPSDDSVGGIANSTVVRAIGAALAAKDEDQRLEALYRQLQSPRSRAELAAGALGELSYPEKP